MRAADVLAWAAAALRGHRRRSLLTLAATAVGVAAVVLLAALGEGTRRFVVDRFTALGTHLVVVLPGRSETVGGPPPLIAETPRELTLADAAAVARLPPVRRVAPVVVGSAPAAAGGREREATVVGTTAEMRPIRRLRLAAGRFLPPGTAARPVCVLGATLARELYPGTRAVGRWLRLGERRCRVIGILAPEGRSLGLDFDEVVLVPVAYAQALFDRSGLFRILAEARDRAALAPARRAIEGLIGRRHGTLDVTVITQDAVVATFDRILALLTRVVAAIAAVSLLVAGILTMNVMLVAVAQRRAEIGLLLALGARRRTVLALFLAEAALLSLAGALAGLALGHLGGWVLARLLPSLPLAVPAWAAVAGPATALAAGAGLGLLPARRAARLDPVAALAGR
ncbi:ABC transporter permease [Inmirania thermothiophila]|uniref:Putative ABC transport system permease protein n=1 Tax=Inmirania thermothiophila TaxID=1750597 RepID=A0A3N1Y704_9GAMM|nr:ABC transporter permease [Inmirania thermothiophila]ROR34604.1 putative ABC transport system permease protein [Inmirania thermothiophila]